MLVGVWGFGCVDGGGRGEREAEVLGEGVWAVEREDGDGEHCDAEEEGGGEEDGEEGWGLGAEEVHGWIGGGGRAERLGGGGVV